MTWCLKFAPIPFASWKDSFTIYLWEGKNRTSYAKARADEQRYIQEAYEDVEMEDVEEGEPEEEDERPSSDVEEPSAEEDDGSSDSEQFSNSNKNQQLAVSYKNDLSFVTRGDMIGVFAHKDDKVKFRTTIDRIKDTQGRTFTPKKVNIVMK